MEVHYLFKTYIICYNFGPHRVPWTTYILILCANIFCLHCFPNDYKEETRDKFYQHLREVQVSRLLLSARIRRLSNLIERFHSIFLIVSLSTILFCHQRRTCAGETFLRFHLSSRLNLLSSLNKFIPAYWLYTGFVFTSICLIWLNVKD